MGEETTHAPVVFVNHRQGESKQNRKLFTSKRQCSWLVDTIALGNLSLTERYHGPGVAERMFAGIPAVAASSFVVVAAASSSQQRQEVLHPIADSIQLPGGGRNKKEKSMGAQTQTRGHSVGTRDC